jgi:hypothetical protein
MKWLRQMLTEDDADAVVDPLRVSFLIAFATGIGLQIYDVVWLTHEFNLITFGTGMGALLVTTGGALWASSKQEKS